MTTLLEALEEFDREKVDLGPVKILIRRGEFSHPVSGRFQSHAEKVWVSIKETFTASQSFPGDDEKAKSYAILSLMEHIASVSSRQEDQIFEPYKSFYGPEFFQAMNGLMEKSETEIVWYEQAYNDLPDGRFEMTMKPTGYSKEIVFEGHPEPTRKTTDGRLIRFIVEKKGDAYEVSIT